MTVEKTAANMPPSSELAIDSSGRKLNKVEVEGCLDELRQLILGDVQFCMRKDDAFLLRFLHCTGFRIDDAFKRIQEMNDLRIENPDWFASTPPSDHAMLLSWNTKVMLDARDKFGRRIYITKIANIDATKTTIQKVAQFDDLWLEAILDEPETQANGLCCIIDMAGFSWKLFRWFTPGNVRIATKRTELLPTKKLVIHVVNSSMLLNATVALVFPFLSAKTKEQIHFHYEDWPSLHKFVNPEYLPVEYGGKLDSLEYAERNNWLVEQTPRLLENFKNDNRL